MLSMLAQAFRFSSADKTLSLFFRCGDVMYRRDEDCKRAARWLAAHGSAKIFHHNRGDRQITAEAACAKVLATRFQHTVHNTHAHKKDERHRKP
jgi:hypothetical protein